MQFSDFQAFVNNVLPGVESIARRYYDLTGEGQGVEYKADNSPVTRADREIEAYLFDQISARFPDHSILGEEGANRSGSEDYTWLLDPIDGTKSFIHHIPLFTTLIGVMHSGRAIYGAIYNPILGDLTVGDRVSAFHNGKPCRVRDCARLEDATLLSSDLFGFRKYRDGDRFEKLVLACRVERSWGDGTGYQMVATGRADIMADAKVNLWDIAAVIPVILGAGGVLRTMDGAEPEEADSLVATCPSLMPQIDLF